MDKILYSQETIRILIIDDEPVSVKNLSYALKKSGYIVKTRTSGIKGMKALEDNYFDIVITDLRMEHIDGMSILEKAISLDDDIAIIMITGHASLNSAIDAMKAGAFHYIEKPFRLEEVREIVKKAVELVMTKRENKHLHLLIDQNLKGPRIITQDTGMKRLLDNMKQIATTDCAVIITGESGTGKELIARNIHDHSHRADKPFIAINCGAFQEELLANELFGHEKGAFTGAVSLRNGLVDAADEGTLFLDEITEMSLSMQVKLLRVIQEQEVQRLGSTTTEPVNVRYIAATNRDLQKEVTSGHFRNDLYYRLNVVSLHLPALSERRDDIPLLAYYFLKKHAIQMGRSIEDITPEAMHKLISYNYPGNIRELENIIERGIALATDKKLTI
ncbi:MAG: sigma-54 dependent transcriptional regulator, partial [Methylococcales bacterium]